jgi:hypothetical protein
MIDIDLAIDILECAKKTGNRDYLAEYIITIKIASESLLEAGFPADKKDELLKYSIDICSLSLFKHKIGLNETSVSLSDCFQTFLEERNEGGLVTDLAWNQTLELIIDELEKNA